MSPPRKFSIDEWHESQIKSHVWGCPKAFLSDLFIRARAWNGSGSMVAFHRLALQSPHMSSPQFRQWCLRFRTPKVWLHNEQESEL